MGATKNRGWWFRDLLRPPTRRHDRNLPQPSQALPAFAAPALRTVGHAMKIKFREGYKYQLAENYYARTFITLPVPVGNHFITLDETGWLTIKADYAWDGPSGPTIDTKNFLRGSLEHDALYQLMREGRLSPEMRQTADLRLHTVCLEDGMCAARAWWVYRGVRYGGESSIQPRVNETLEAP